MLWLHISGAFNLASDVVALAEERVPVVQDFLVLVRQVVPFRPAFFFLQ